MKVLTYVAIPLLLIGSAVSAAPNSLYIGGKLSGSFVDGIADDELTTFSGTGLPTEITINGLPFDDESVGWGLFVGYELLPFLALEFGYADLGEFESVRLGLPPASGAELDVSEIHLATKFQAPIASSVHAHWHLGATWNTYDVEGRSFITTSFTPLNPPAFFTPGFTPFGGRLPVSQIDFASPDNDFGLTWGFGFRWQFRANLGLSLDYRQHKTDVIDVETIGLSLLWFR